MAHDDATEPDAVVPVPSLADGRDRAADDRDGVAGTRDTSAEARDRTAIRRDDSAGRRDRNADLRDARAERAESVANPGMSSAAEAFVAQLRLDARHDRQEALRDREASATGRSDASNDRHDATGDRTSSAADRHAAEGDREEAALDALTGVYTRLAGFVQLEREMARAYRAHAPLAVAFIDVDGLKAVNDRHGHLAGDNLLRAVVRTLRDHMRTEDLIFRYGGDEFICVFSGLAATHATRRIEDVNRALSDRPEHSSVSAGISELRRPDSVTDLICRADAALYRGRRLASRR